MFRILEDQHFTSCTLDFANASRSEAHETAMEVFVSGCHEHFVRIQWLN
jgi:hypothetical protein